MERGYSIVLVSDLTQKKIYDEMSENISDVSFSL